MSDFSTNLQLSYLVANQAQKHVTVNETLRRLDALVQLSVQSSGLLQQPAAPSDGVVYILPPGKTGTAWGAMADHALAYYVDGVWEAIQPRAGWHVYDIGRAAFIVWTGVQWRLAQSYFGALFELSANQTVPSAAHTTLSFVSTVRDVGGWRVAGQPSKLKVPKGISRVRVRANAAFSPHAAGTRSVRLLKNGASLKGNPFQRMPSAGASLWTALNIASGVLDVVENDTFEVSVFQDCGTALQVQMDDSTWFEIEACG